MAAAEKAEKAAAEHRDTRPRRSGRGWRSWRSGQGCSEIDPPSSRISYNAKCLERKSLCASCSCTATGSAFQRRERPDNQAGGALHDVRFLHEGCGECHRPRTAAKGSKPSISHDGASACPQGGQPVRGPGNRCQISPCPGRASLIHCLVKSIYKLIYLIHCPDLPGGNHHVYGRTAVLTSARDRTSRSRCAQMRP